MRHLIIYSIILVMVIAFMIYKVFELFINLPLDEDEEIVYQMDMFGTKRLLLEKIRIR